jgi:GDPmannose 4,6-dehydratase
MIFFAVSNQGICEANEAFSVSLADFYSRADLYNDRFSFYEWIDFSMSKTAIITGITGQDGSYLAELLLDKGYQVHGIVRRSSSFSTGRIDHLYRDIHEKPSLILHYGDLTDGQALTNLVLELEPDEIYNLGAQSHVRVSFDQPVYTLMTDGVGALNVLEAARILHRRKPVRVYQASSSEMYGMVLETPQSELTPFNPQSPYACAKVYAFFQTVNYRRSYGLFACNGILFNHESPRRGETFVTRKITRAATRIKVGLQNKLYLGNLDAKRDWGFAKDYVEAMWLMLQQDEPDDFVIATGETYSIRDFLDMVFGELELDWQEFVEIDPRYFRPAEVDLLLGDPSKAKKKLGWNPRTDVRELARLMVEHDLELARRELHSRSFAS